MLDSNFKTDAFNQLIEQYKSIPKSETYFARYLHFGNKLVKQIDEI